MPPGDGARPHRPRANALSSAVILVLGSAPLGLRLPVTLPAWLTTAAVFLTGHALRLGSVLRMRSSLRARGGLSTAEAGPTSTGLAGLA